MQRSGDVLQEVRRRDEEHLGEIERHRQVVVGEAVVLRRVEHLEQRARRIALEGDAELVDLVEQEDRVLGAGLFHALENPAGQRADVGAPVAADVGLVAGAAQRDADVLAPHRPGDRLGDRGLADARRAGEEEDAAACPSRLAGLLLHGAGLRLPVDGVGLLLGLGLFGRLARLLRKLPHRQELEDPILDVLQAVVVLVQDARGLGNVQLLLGARVPGQLRDRLEIRADDLRLHRLAADASQPVPLPVDLLAGILREIQSVELRLELLEPVVGGAVAFAQLLLDRLELLAQVHLALAAADLFLDLGLDVLLGREHLDLPLDADQDAAQPVLDRERLQESLLVGNRDVEVSGHQVRQPSGLVDLRQDLLDRLVGKAQLLAELGRALAGLAVQAGEGRVVRVERQHLARLLDRRPRDSPSCWGRSAGRCLAPCPPGPGGCRPARAGPIRSWRSCRWRGGRTRTRPPCRPAARRRRPAGPARSARTRSRAASPRGRPRSETRHPETKRRSEAEPPEATLTLTSRYLFLLLLPAGAPTCGRESGVRKYAEDGRLDSVAGASDPNGQRTAATRTGRKTEGIPGRSRYARRRMTATETSSSADPPPRYLCMSAATSSARA